MSVRRRTGHVQFGLTYAFLSDPNRAWSTQDLMSWTHVLPLYQGRRSRRHRQNYCRSIHRADRPQAGARLFCRDRARQYQALSREASILLRLAMGHDPPAPCRLTRQNARGRESFPHAVARPRSAPPVLLRLPPHRLRTLGSCSPVGRAPGGAFQHDALEARGEPTQASIDSISLILRRVTHRDDTTGSCRSAVGCSARIDAAPTAWHR